MALINVIKTRFLMKLYLIKLKLLTVDIQSDVTYDFKLSDIPAEAI